MALAHFPLSSDNDISFVLAQNNVSLTIGDEN
jgi:hypothetical protein